MIFDFCVIGHITRDRIQIADKSERIQTGGTVYYSGLTAARLGLRTAAITKLCSRDRDVLLADMQAAGIDVRAFDSPATTTYVNRFASDNLDDRVQKVLALAHPFHPDEINVDAEAYVFGPLTHSEVPAACIEKAALTGRWIALDVQGLLRHVRGSRVELVPTDAARRMLRHVEVLKASEEEALLMTGSSTIAEAARALSAAGPDEVLVTSGSAGSHVLAGGTLIEVPAYAPPTVVNTTGCGDTYLAAYVVHRLEGRTPGEAGDFASRVAGAKTACHRAFRGDVDRSLLAVGSTYR